MSHFQTHHKSKQHLESFFMKNPFMDFKWKGKLHHITYENFDAHDKKLQQSFVDYCSKQNKSQQPQSGSGKSSENNSFEKTIQEVLVKKAKESKQGEKGTETFGPYHQECKDVKDFDLIKYHIIRLAKSEKLIEEKLDYPKVFRALITQPHTILEQTKKTIEDDLNLTVFVNINCNYYPQQYKSFPNSVLEVCKSLKGITVFSSRNLTSIKGINDKEYYYYTEILSDLPESKKQRILVINQGCGSIPTPMFLNNDVKKYHKNIRHCTPFIPPNSCGCNQVDLARVANIPIIGGVCSAKDLAKVEF